MAGPGRPRKDAKEGGAVAVAEPEQEQDQTQDGTIYVRATQIGYYENLRRYPIGFDHPRAGEIFELIDRETTRKGKLIRISAVSQFSEKWMQRVGDAEAEKDMATRRRLPPKRAIITKDAANRSVI